MKIGVIGAGQVGGTLGTAWAKKGHQVMFASTDPSSAKMRELLAKAGPNSRAGSNRQVAEFADVIVFATPWGANGGATEAAIRDAGDLTGKIVIDATNPLTADLSLERGHTTSGGETVAGWARGARVYKTMNQVGFGWMADGSLAGRRAVMFVAGDEAEGKKAVLKLVDDLGFEASDAGNLKSTRLLEPMAALWIKLAVQQKWGPDFAFSLLRRP